jgi:NADPH-dependent glutamate synthase beta subunit-like oxidoreductase
MVPEACGKAYAPSGRGLASHRSGKTRSFCRISGAKKSIQPETIIFAIGEEPDVGLLGCSKGLEITQRNALKIDSLRRTTSMDKVFAAGDAFHGPSSVAQAIGTGRIAAVAINNFLIGKLPWVCACHDRGGSES